MNATFALMNNTLATREITPYCPFYRQAVELIGRKWSGAIIRALLCGTTQFSEFAELIPGISDRLISVRLREFEAKGIVERVVVPEKLVRIHYRLTPMGEDLGSVVLAIANWAETWLQAGHAPTNEID